MGMAVKNGKRSGTADLGKIYEVLLSSAARPKRSRMSIAAGRSQIFSALAVVPFAAGLVLLAPHALARPHALALPVMVAFAGGLVRAVDRNRRPSWWLLPLMVLWANLHGGFTLGILLTGAAGLDAVVAADSGQRKNT